MKSLDRKLLRDLRLMWSQALTIALVVASGIGGFITSLSAVDSLELARDRFYAEGRFADLFANVKRAPLALTETLREVPGVADVQTSLAAMVRLEVPGSADPVLGELIGVDARQPARMNLVTTRGAPLSDLAIAGDGSLPAFVSEGFAQARGLKPGARIVALINGRKRELRMIGTALSPEYIFAGLWGMPDLRGYGIFWIDREQLAAAYDMQGAFNRVAVKLAPQASQRAAMEGLVARLAPYGGRDVIAREHQASHLMLDNEIQEQRVLGTALPAIFLGVAAFLLNVVVSRLVGTQREQIAALKALGYTNRSIARHYLELVLLIVALGLVLGIALGDRLGTMFTGLYAEFYRFPTFEHRIEPGLLVISLSITVLTAVAGTLNAILATARLAPAEAMRPPAPGVFRRTLIERLGIRRIGMALRMILRNMERRPLRSTLGIVGIAAAVAITMMGNFFRDAIDAIVDTQFSLVLRGDVTVWATEALDLAAQRELGRLPGVVAVDAVRFVPVEFVHGHRRERSLIRGYPARSQLYRVIGADNRERLIDDNGLVMTDRLAAKLDLKVGDRVEVQMLEGRGRVFEQTLAATVDETMGLNAYMDRQALNRAIGEADLATGFVLGVDRLREGAVLEATKALPRVAGAFSKATMLRNMDEISARNVRIMSTILTLFASVISIGVVYNNARIALAERGWELASLRVLGFTRAEVSALLLGEMALSIAIALPLGMALGWAMVHGLTGALSSDQFSFPVVIQARTYAWAAVCVVVAGAASALVVRRRIDRLDMVGVLKTRQ